MSSQSITPRRPKTLPAHLQSTAHGSQSQQQQGLPADEQVDLYDRFIPSRIATNWEFGSSLIVAASTGTSSLLLSPSSSLSAGGALSGASNTNSHNSAISGGSTNSSHATARSLSSAQALLLQSELLGGIYSPPRSALNSQAFPTDSTVASHVSPGRLSSDPAAASSPTASSSSSSLSSSAVATSSTLLIAAGSSPSSLFNFHTPASGSGPSPSRRAVSLDSPLASAHSSSPASPGAGQPRTLSSSRRSGSRRVSSPYFSPVSHVATNPHTFEGRQISPYSSSLIGTTTERLLLSPKPVVRKIPRHPWKVLDAPSLSDDFYLNLLDWSSLNVVSVALDSCVYLWNANTSKVSKLCDVADFSSGMLPNGTLQSVSVTAVGFMQRGSHLAIGTSLGTTHVWDTERERSVRVLGGHALRVGTLAWNGPILASGSKDKTIVLHDVRSPTPEVCKLADHKQEVCGLKWSPDGQLLASGGNDNKLLVWSMGQKTEPLYRFTDHLAAVKAIAWSPHQHGLLASGGGTADKKIRFWNTLTGHCLSAHDTGSQVCNLAWSKSTKELVSTHGYSQNQVVVWKYPQMEQLASLSGHTMRVLYLAMSPEGETIVTGAGDETLRFWHVFTKPQPATVRPTTLASLSQIR